MMKRHELPNASSIYGSSMGRKDYTSTDKAQPFKVYLRRVYINNGGYDAGGAYWGRGALLYHAEADPIWLESEQRDAEGFEMYLRAANRDHAKERVIDNYPNAKFYR